MFFSHFSLILILYGNYIMEFPNYTQITLN